MKKVLAVLSLLSLAACSSTYKVKGYEGPEVIGRSEVIQYSRECMRSKMKPTTEYVAQKVEGGNRVLVPVDVRCDSY